MFNKIILVRDLARDVGDALSAKWYSISKVGFGNKPQI